MSPHLKRPRRRAALLALAGLLVLAAGAAAALKPFAEARIERRLSDRVGPVDSLSVEGSPLSLARGRADALDVDFASAQLAGTGRREGGLDRVRELDLTARELTARGMRFEQVTVRKDGDEIHARLLLEPQRATVRGATLQVSPEAVDGELVLELGGGRRIRVFSADGALRAGLATDGPLGGLSRAVGRGRLRVDRLEATDAGDGVWIELDGRVA